MQFFDLITQSGDDTLRSLWLFLPELVLCGTILALLLVRLCRTGRQIDQTFLAIVGCGLAIAAQAYLLSLENAGTDRQEMFTGLLIYDGFTAYFRIFLLLFATLFFILGKITGIPDRQAAPDIYTLVLGATLGMCLMVSANQLLVVFLAVEMASVPSYVLAGLLKGRRQSSEAALKYAIYGAGAAGVMLYGISLAAGVLGSVHLPTMAAVLDANWNTFDSGEQMALTLGGLMIMVGLAFKLSAVPFHLWCPDVFEGASAEVNAFLSVASKAAALALLVRVALGFSHIPADRDLAIAPPVAVGQVATALQGTADINTADVDTVALTTGNMSVADLPHDAQNVSVTTSTTEQASSGLSTVRDFIWKLIAFLSVITCTFGNLAAYGQTNIKRMLAYSTIAHAGYMMMAVAAAIALLGRGTDAQVTYAVAALTIHVTMYLFMNLGAFAVVAFLRNKLHSEKIEDYAGLIHQCPVMVICFSLMLFSLVGLPPLAGFAGKVNIFLALADAQLWPLLIIAGLNTAVSLFYYLRVVKVMTIDPEPEDRLAVDFSPLSAETIYVFTAASAVVVFGIFWQAPLDVAREVASKLL